jgi:hypothetical protein
MGAILKRDKEGVLTVFDLQGKPMWSIWENVKEPSFSCSEDDADERRKMLEKYLDIIKDSASTAAFTIKFHDECSKNGRINNNTPVIGALPFRMNEADAAVATRGGAAGGSIELLNQLFAARMENIEQRWQQKFDQQERDHQEEIEDLEEDSKAKRPKLGAIGMVGETFREYPEIKELCKPLIEGLTDLLTFGKYKVRQHTQPQQQPGGIAGVKPDTAAPPQQRIDTALRRLLTWYTVQEGDINDQAARAKGATKLAEDLESLAKLAEDPDPDMIHLALKKLRQFGS